LVNGQIKKQLAVRFIALFLLEFDVKSTHPLPIFPNFATSPKSLRKVGTDVSF
jgi:hypothetical protein